MKNKPLPWSWLNELFKSEVRSLSERRIGLEVERIAIWKDGSPFLYRTRLGKPGAEELLQKLHKAYGWPLVESSLGEPIGLETPEGKISLEPGSQLEFAVYPQKTLSEIAHRLQAFDAQVDRVIQDWKGLCFLGLAVNPLHRLEELDVIPSPRYHIMTEVLGKTGKFGTSMMRRTSSVQVNLDYTSEEEAIEMLRVALLVAPVSHALFANSPFMEGKQTDFLSMRAEIWRHTDAVRTGLLSEAFEKGFDFSAYAALLWRLPLMFVTNERKEVVNAQGMSLQEISEGKLSGVKASQANMRSAVQQLFTEARLKPGYVEIRSIDGQLPAYRLAAAAFWLGLLYDAEARQIALKLLGSIPSDQREKLSVDASRAGLKTQIKNDSLLSIAVKLVAASEEGLKKRRNNEEVFLIPLKENLEKGLSPADILLDKFKHRWQGQLSEMLKKCHSTLEKIVGEA